MCNKLRVRTTIGMDEEGYYCCALFWFNEEGIGPPDEQLNVGPFKTEAEAEANLTGKFRDAVVAVMRKLRDEKGLKIRVHKLG